MKVNKTYISIPKKPTFEVNVGDEFDGKDGVYEIVDIDVTENATYITVSDKSGKETAYGSKVFMEKFKATA